MRERPIIFSAPMVRAILDGRKTVTRRVVKPQPSSALLADFAEIRAMRGSNRTDAQMLSDCLSCPYGAPGDHLWLREAWQALDGNERARRILTEPDPSRGWIEYAATVPEGYEPPPRWRPSIHMPRWASRITLEIESVRVERLQDISVEDCRAEGGIYDSPVDVRAWYRDLWDSINGKPIPERDADDRPTGRMLPNPARWEANPYVWVVSFRRIAP